MRLGNVAVVAFVVVVVDVVVAEKKAMYATNVMLLLVE